MAGRSRRRCGRFSRAEGSISTAPSATCRAAAEFSASPSGRVPEHPGQPGELKKPADQHPAARRISETVGAPAPAQQQPAEAAGHQEEADDAVESGPDLLAQ